MTNMDTIIARLTRKTFIPRELFILSATGKSAMYEALDRAARKGLIREKRIVKKTAARKQKTTYAYSLTEKGYAFFFENLRGKVPWGEYFSASKAAVEKNFSSSALSLDRYLAICTASELCELAGAEPHTLFYTPLATGRYSSVETNADPLPKIATEAEKVFKESQTNGAGEEFIFVDSVSIKRALITNAKTHGLAVPDVRGGRFTGMVGNSGGAIMLYNASNISPLDCTDAFEKRERTAYMLALRIVFRVLDCNMFSAVYGRGALIVDGVEAFAKSFLSGYERRRPLGKSFAKFWAIPVSSEGVSELQALMNGTGDREREQVVARLFARGYTNTGRCYASSAFPFTSPSGKLSTVLLHLDAGDIYKILTTIEHENGSGTYKIICKGWMVPYIKSVVTDPKVELVPIHFTKKPR